MNKTDVRQHVELYPAAATIDQGQFLFSPGRAGNELTSWIFLEHSAVELAPGERAQVAVTVAVPPTAPAGERYAVLWASVSSRSAPDPEQGGNVRQVHRTGVRVYLDVGSGGEPASGFTIGQLTTRRDGQGRPLVDVEVTNTGGRALDLDGSATLTDGPAGMGAGPFDVVSGTTLAPGQSGTITIRLPRDVPDAQWTIEVHLASGTVENQTSARITFSSSDAVAKSADSRTLPWWLVGSGVLVLALLTVAVLWLRTRWAGRSVFVWNSRSILEGADGQDAAVRGDG